MLALLLVVGITLGFSHWLVQPLIQLLTPLLTLAWVGWGLLLLLAWLFAGSTAQGGGAGSGEKRRQSTMLTGPRERSG